MEPLSEVLTHLNAVPGVVGSIVSDQDGRILAHAFPQLFEPAMLQEASTSLADSAVGLQGVTGPVGTVDLRYGDARIVLKPVPGALVLLLCARNINLQLLSISFSVAARKLEKLVPEILAARTPPAGDGDEPARGKKDKKEKDKAKGPKWWPSV